MITPAKQLMLFLAVAQTMLAVSIQFSLTAVVVPDVADQFQVPVFWLNWVFTAYTLTHALAMPLAGALCLKFRQPLVIRAALVAFTIASALSALAPNIYALVAARALLGAAGGTLFPAAYDILDSAFTERRAQAIALLSPIFPLSSLLGSILGGVLIDYADWRWAFALSGALVLPVLPVFAMTRFPARRRYRRVDVTGALILAVAIAAFLYAATETTRPDRNVLVIGVLLPVSTIAALVYYQHQSRVHQPVVDLRMLVGRKFWLVNALNFAHGISIFGVFSFLPWYFDVRYGMSAPESAPILALRAIPSMLAAAWAGLTVSSIGYRRPAAASLALVAVTLVLLSLGLSHLAFGPFTLRTKAYLTCLVCLIGFAVGLAEPAIINSGLGIAQDRVASLAGIRGMCRSVGGAVGASLITGITTVIGRDARGLELSFLTLAIVIGTTIWIATRIPDHYER